ncbi:MAG TPA: RNA-binding cell elongation regulator Jag/EloR [Feifaniaceae bacterium]|nr:RNA-binding cell elongation regulator Jag/EloR [Feifaniaceae bacterium]
MKSGEFTGRSIDEAVFHGLQELGLSIDEVQIETLQNESKGLFGIGAKLARVRLTERGQDELPVHRPRAGEEREQRPERAREQRENRPQGGERRESRPGGQRQSEARREERPQTRREEPSKAPQPPAEEYAYSAEVAANHPAGQFLSGLLTHMGVEADVRAAEVENGVRLSIDSRTKGLLIGRRGETLDAMQYLTSLAVNRTRKQEKYLRVTLDTEDYRSKREDTLVRLARRQAARVKSTGRPIAMEPMNPYERRVLHASLQNSPYVTTHSEGEEPNRRVVITPKK